MKVERQVEALKEKWSVDTDRCSAEKGGNDESVAWLNERKHFTGEQRFWQCWKQTIEISVGIWSLCGGIRLSRGNTI